MKKLAALFSSIFLTTLMLTTLVQASGPRFNFLEGDYKTLRGLNLTAEEGSWHDPVEGEIGDTIAWNIYIHNGVEGTVAENTVVSVELPQKSTSQIELQATISASNAEEINDTASLNLTNPGIIEYLPQSTELYDKNGEKVKDLPDGITAGGIDLGEIQGCWPYAVFVVFKTKLRAFEDKFLTLDKKVRNYSAAESFRDSNTAGVGEVLEYQISVENPGISTYEFFLKDILPSEFEYQDNSLSLYIDDTLVQSIDLSTIFNEEGLALYLESGSELQINFKAVISSRALIGSSFRNTAILYNRDKTLSASAQTTVVPRGSVLGAATLPITGSPITLSLALAFLGSAIYYFVREEKLFRSALIAVRTF